MPQYVTFHLGLHCLYKSTHLGVFRIQWLNQNIHKPSGSGGFSLVKPQLLKKICGKIFFQNILNYATSSAEMVPEQLLIKNHSA